MTPLSVTLSTCLFCVGFRFLNETVKAVLIGFLSMRFFVEAKNSSDKTTGFHGRNMSPDSARAYTKTLRNRGLGRTWRFIGEPPVAGKLKQDVDIDGVETESILFFENYRRHHGPPGVHQLGGPFCLVAADALRLFAFCDCHANKCTGENPPFQEVRVMDPSAGTSRGPGQHCAGLVFTAAVGGRGGSDPLQRNSR